MMSRKNNIKDCYGEKGICLYEYPVINGIKQYVQVRGADRKNPLMLFVHGGPGGSVAGMCHVLQPEWEKKYTVVNWDQRNSCMTYLANKENAGKISETGSLDDYISDIDGVIRFLHTVYDFKKVILAGFSWGSVIGAEYAKRHPENVSCYIGIGQLINYREALKVTCERLEKLTEGTGDKAKIKKIAASVPKEDTMTPEFFRSVQMFSVIGTKYLAKHTKAFPFFKLLTSPFLDLNGKLAMLRSDPALLKGTYRTLFSYDFRRNMNFKVPVMFISGEDDFVCPYQLVSDSFEKIKAPDKKIKLIRKAAHMCFFDQPDDFINEVVSFTDALK